VIAAYKHRVQHAREGNVVHIKTMPGDQAQVFPARGGKDGRKGGMHQRAITALPALADNRHLLNDGSAKLHVNASSCAEPIQP
jgi:hypothetical protein